MNSLPSNQVPGRTPPQIVADALSQTQALAAFIAQEMETWGFAIDGEAYDGDNHPSVVVLNADGYKLRVEVARV